MPGVTRERMLPLRLVSTRAFSFRRQNVQSTRMLPVEREKKIRENGQVQREPPKSGTPCRKPRMWARVAMPRVTVAERSHLAFTLFFFMASTGTGTFWVVVEGKTIGVQSSS